jgi:hypothetical protein
VHGLQAVKDQHTIRVETLTRLLGETFVDDDEVEHHGLTWLYPLVKKWPMVRSLGGGSGKPGSRVPFNAAALDFLGSFYWTGESSQDRCSHAELMDEDNYQPGFEPTVLGMERSVRIALKTGPPPTRQPQVPGDILKPIPAVVDAIAWLLAAVDAIAADPNLYALVKSEATRLATRAASMIFGSRFSASRSQCPHCYQPDSVISDEDRAVCVNPWCRTATGGRSCWEWLANKPALAADDWRPQWIEVPEPDVRGRGQVSDEQLSRWAQTG